jgi:hypothetical protein
MCDMIGSQRDLTSASMVGEEAAVVVEVVGGVAVVEVDVTAVEEPIPFCLVRRARGIGSPVEQIHENVITDRAARVHVWKQHQRINDDTMNKISEGYKQTKIDKTKKHLSAMRERERERERKRVLS